MRFLRMVAVDTLVLIKDAKGRFIPVVLFLIFNVVALRASLAYYSNYAQYGFDTSLTCIDVIVNLFMGIRPIRLSISEQFSVPFEWLITLLAPSYLVSGFVERLRGRESVLFLSFCGNRWKCWLVRFCSVVNIVFLYLIIMFVVSFSLVCLLGGSSSMGLSNGFIVSSSAMANISVLPPYECWMTISSCFVLTALFTIAYSLTSFFIGSACSFLVLAVYLTCSAFFSHPLWLANYAMVARSGEFYTAGCNPLIGMGLSVSLALTAVIAGGLYFNSCDLLER